MSMMEGGIDDGGGKGIGSLRTEGGGDPVQDGVFGLRWRNRHIILQVPGAGRQADAPVGASIFSPEGHVRLAAESEGCIGMEGFEERGERMK